MLPGLGFSEIVLLGVIALLVVGPKDLPLLLRRIGQFSARVRGLAAEFRAGFDELARSAELDQLKQEVDSLRNAQALRDLGRSVAELRNAPNLLGPEGEASMAPPVMAPPVMAPPLEPSPAEALAPDAPAAQAQAAEGVHSPAPIPAPSIAAPAAAGGV